MRTIFDHSVRLGAACILSVGIYAAVQFAVEALTGSTWTITASAAYTGLFLLTWVTGYFVAAAVSSARIWRYRWFASFLVSRVPVNLVVGLGLSASVWTALELTLHLKPFSTSEEVGQVQVAALLTLAAMVAAQVAAWNIVIPNVRRAFRL